MPKAAKLDFNYPRLLKLFPQYRVAGRFDSAAFLIWYLENYYRLSPEEAIDCVCDKRGDKGVDGIYVNDTDQTITVFQSTISQKNRGMGDTAPKEFIGTLTQFSDADSVANLVATAGKAAVATLITRLEIVEKLSTHVVRGEFLSNIDPDVNGSGFLKHAANLTFIGRTRLAETYVSDERNQPIHARIKFDRSGFGLTEYKVDTQKTAIIFPVKATELVGLDGIANQSLFTYNVRGKLGRSPVNRQIAESIGERKLHKLFPLFHNGITIIARNLKFDDQFITISDYFVVNGCQSLTALYDNRDKLTDKLRVLTKFIHMEPESPESKMVTVYSNTQNGVRPRDFMSNNPIQIRLQNEFRNSYGGTFAYEIKRGEELRGEVIDNEDAGIYLMAFDLKQPWAAHRKYQIFQDLHSKLFGRREVTADRIVFCKIIADAIKSVLTKIENRLIAQYNLTEYLLLYTVRLILEKDEFGEQVLREPKSFVRHATDRRRFRQYIEGWLNDSVIDLNAELEDEIKQAGDDFDYRDKLRDEAWVSKIAGRLVAEHQKSILRKRVKSFRQEWELPRRAKKKVG